MDDTTRAELDKIHSRINETAGRVIVLEAQQPHITAALVRIEAKSDKLAAAISRFLGFIGLAVLGPIIALMFKVFASGALSNLI